jgi:Holliday junction resolvasome RuvABC endonuclease subunit
MTARVVGLDLSITATGAADAEGERTTFGGTAKIGDKRLAIINAHVHDLIRVGVDLVVIEDIPTHAHGAGITGMVHGAARLACLSLGVPYALVTPATLKKYATGRGNADKSDMRMALFQRAGIDERDDNRVDAYWLRAAGMQHLGQPIIDLPKAQTETLDKVNWPEQVTS